MSFSKDTKEAFSYGWLIGLVCVGVFIAIALFGAMSLPFVLLGKTFNANNIVQRYEWFHDANANVGSRVAQIKVFKQILATTTDPAELSRLRIEYAAIQQSCRDLTNQYNANASKVNVTLFQNGVPTNLNPANCE